MGSNAEFRRAASAVVAALKEEGRFSKPGLGDAGFKADTVHSEARSQLRLLVHAPGCPQFICTIGENKTVGELQGEIAQQHRELFSGGDIPTPHIRWLEDSQRNALAASSLCCAVLADREKIYACTGFDPTRESVFEPSGTVRGALELVAAWRNQCLDTASRLSALAQQEGREEEVFEAGGLQVMLSIAVHSGHLMPGDVALRDVHAGLRALLEHEDAASRMIEAACEGQVVALLQVPDPDLAALAAFMCSRLATNRDSHVTLLSWGAPARLAKAVQLSGNVAVRLDAMKALRLLAGNHECHSALLAAPVLRVVVRAAGDLSETALCLKALRAIGEIAAAGDGGAAEALKRAKVLEALQRTCRAHENDVRRAAVYAMSSLFPGGEGGYALPSMGIEGMSDQRSTKTPAAWDPLQVHGPHAGLRLLSDCRRSFSYGGVGPSSCVQHARRRTDRHARTRARTHAHHTHAHTHTKEKKRRRHATSRR